VELATDALGLTRRETANGILRGDGNSEKLATDKHRCTQINSMKKLIRF
jgi:hypothetical protein